MNVAQLRTLLASLPDDAPILLPVPDHGYAEVRAEAGTALRSGRRQWTEDFGEELTPEAQYGRRVPALIVGA